MEDMTIDGFNGLAKSEPLIAALLAIFFLSLAGIPLTGGFFAKYYMLASVVKTGNYIGLVIIGVLFAAVSVYYYFKVIQAMYFKDGTLVFTPVTAGFKYLLLAVAVMIVVLGVYPNALLEPAIFLIQRCFVIWLAQFLAFLLTGCTLLTQHRCVTLLYSITLFCFFLKREQELLFLSSCFRFNCSYSSWYECCTNKVHLLLVSYLYKLRKYGHEEFRHISTIVSYSKK
jgi:formate hydrogenlyase subunit 3/multisubunit Na+/H+ antiporter MnhD subunit